MPISQGLKDADRHAAGVTLLQPDTSSDQPDYKGISYRKQIKDVELCRAVYGGTKTIREGKTAYLPMHPKEQEDEYDRRLKRAVLFNAFRRTVGGLVGMIYRKDPIFSDDMPDAFVEDLDNIDQASHSLPVFARMSTTDAMIDGHTWWHVEFPQVPAVQNRAQERQLGVRPYWIRVRKADAINVQWEMVGGQPKINLFVYFEGGTEPDGEFGEAETPRIRVLRPGIWQIWETDSKNRWQLADKGMTSLNYVPVVFVPTNATDHFESEPPLLDLAYENIDHYQIRSDHRHAAMFASTPMPVFIGTESKNVTWGANRALFIPEEGAKAQILESTGASLEQTRQDLKDSEARMAALGLQMLVRETRAAETAQAKLLDKSESESSLSVVARGIENAIEQALAIHADYLGVEPGTVSVNRDFHEQPLDATVIAQLSGMVAAGQLSLDSMWAALVEGEVLPEEFDPDEERERIDSVAPAPVT